MCIDRLTTEELPLHGNSQPCFTSGLSNYRNKVCQTPSLFCSVDGMTTSSDTQTAQTCLFPLYSQCTCYPTLQASSTLIKGAELFSSRKLIQHLSPGFILGIQNCVLCEHECNMHSVCIAESGREWTWGFESERLLVFVWDQGGKRKKERKYRVWLFCVRIWVWTYGDYKADSILFSGNGLSKGIMGIDGLILWGVRLAITQTEVSGIINDIQYTLWMSVFHRSMSQTQCRTSNVIQKVFNKHIKLPERLHSKS